MIDGVIVKVRGHGIRGHIVGRPLYRRKGKNILPKGQHHNAPRVLARTPSHPGTSRHDPLYLTVPFMLSSFFIISLYIPEGRLVRQGCDGSRPEGLLRAEDHLRIFMGLGLILPGKVQVNIRLLVPLKAQKGFKGNIKAFLMQQLPTLGAGPVRHINSRRSCVGLHLLAVKIHKVTVAAVVVGT